MTSDVLCEITVNVNQRNNWYCDEYFSRHLEVGSIINDGAVTSLKNIFDYFEYFLLLNGNFVCLFDGWRRLRSCSRPSGRQAKVSEVRVYSTTCSTCAVAATTTTVGRTPGPLAGATRTCCRTSSRLRINRTESLYAQVGVLLQFFSTTRTPCHTCAVFVACLSLVIYVTFLSFFRISYVYNFFSFNKRQQTSAQTSESLVCKQHYTYCADLWIK